MNGEQLAIKGMILKFPLKMLTLKCHDTIRCHFDPVYKGHT